jgi:hypothetical protein
MLEKTIPMDVIRINWRLFLVVDSASSETVLIIIASS